MYEWLRIYGYLFSLPLIGVIFIIFMMRNNNYWRDRGVPYIKPIPIFGNALDFFLCKTFHGSFFRRIYENSSGSLVGFFILDKPCLMVRDGELAKKIMIKDFNHFMNRTSVTNSVYDPVGTKSLFVSHGTNWLKDRRGLSPVFSSGKLKSKMTHLQVIGNSMIDAIRDKINHDRNLLAIKEITNLYTVNAILSVFFSINGDIDKESPFFDLTTKLYNSKAKWLALQATYMFMAPQLFQLLRMNLLDKASTDFFRDLSWSLLSERERMNLRNNDLVDVLQDIKKKENIHDKSQGDIFAAHCFIMFAAGFETTSSTLTYVLFELAKNPKLQDLVREEINAVLKKHGEFSYEFVKDLKFSKNCILETLRMYPIDTIIDRQCTKDYKVPDMDLVVEKGTPIFISLWGMQNDPKYFPNPSQFDPNRFDDEIIRSNTNFSFLAFGGGPRSCPGKHFGLFNATFGLSKILLNFEVKLPKGAPTVIEPSPFGRTFQPSHDIYLKLVEL